MDKFINKLLLAIAYLCGAIAVIIGITAAVIMLGFIFIGCLIYLLVYTTLYPLIWIYENITNKDLKGLPSVTFKNL